LVGQYPLGGVAWDYFHYLIGLHELGHDVYYHEDTWVWPYDPVKQSPCDTADNTVAFFQDFFAKFAPKLADRWHYVLLHEKHFGMDAAAFSEISRTADIYLNVSGACMFPDDLSPKCLKVFLDTDPGYNQIMLKERFAWSENVDRWCKQVADHDRHLTYAENIWAEDSLMPRLNFKWNPTRCVVSLKSWESVKNSPISANAPMSTVMTWDWFRGKLIYNGVEYGSKGVEFEKFHDLPLRVKMPLALAIGGFKAPVPQLQRDNWRIIDAHTATLTPASYQHLIQTSAGEWSVAKNVYVALRTGWFSCRTACYLAAGRPAVVQDTAWSKFIPSGKGVIGFETMDEAIAGLSAIAADPAAYEIAREYLAPDRVLPGMIESIYT
jgi:hypothetical protein